MASDDVGLGYAVVGESSERVDPHNLCLAFSVSQLGIQCDTCEPRHFHLNWSSFCSFIVASTYYCTH